MGYRPNWQTADLACDYQNALRSAFYAPEMIAKPAVQNDTSDGQISSRPCHAQGASALPGGSRSHGRPMRATGPKSSSLPLVRNHQCRIGRPLPAQDASDSLADLVRMAAQCGTGPKSSTLPLNEQVNIGRLFTTRMVRKSYRRVKPFARNLKLFSQFFIFLILLVWKSRLTGGMAISTRLEEEVSGMSDRLCKANLLVTVSGPPAQNVKEMDFSNQRRM